MKIQKKEIGRGWGVGSGRGIGLGVQGRYERRIEVVEKIHQKIRGGGGQGGVRVGGVRVDVNEELKFS